MSALIFDVERTVPAEGGFALRGHADAHQLSGAKNPAVGQCTEDDQQDGRPDKGNDDFNQEIAHGDPGKAGEPAPEETAQDSDDDVPDQAHALARQHFAGQEPGNAADDDQDDETSHG